MNPPLKVRITAHRDFLIIEPIGDLSQNDYWFPLAKGRIGSVLLVTSDSKDRLEISEEALALMTKIRRGRDSIGDINWWQTETSAGPGTAFSWFGSLYRLVHVPTAEADRDFQVLREECTIITNQASQEAIDNIDSKHKL